jgi:oligoendopeptidase F
MALSLPDTAIEFKDWPWSRIEPYFQELARCKLNETSVGAWLADWSDLSKLLDEAYWRLYAAVTVDTTDEQAEQAYNRFLDEVRPRARAEEQVLKEMLLQSGLEPPGFALPLRNLRSQAETFRQDNLPLQSEEKKLSAEYDKICGAQTVIWDGKEVTLPQLLPVYQEPDRERRERAWRLATKRQMADRQAINELWQKLLAVRFQLAANAGLPSYRDYRWRELLRFDYTPQDCTRFHQAIEEVVVPAARAIYEKRRARLGVSALRPWDLDADPFNRPPLKPFTSVEELEAKTAAIFGQVDPQLGAYFAIMRQEDLLDLDNRKGKAPGGYCVPYMAARRPFIFMNAVGLHDDIQTLLHEGGHAFHDFECSHLSFHHQELPMEFAEVASTAMEYLGAPYLSGQDSSFYSPAEAARARIEHLERALLFWPYMAVVDAFQHWVYENPRAATDPAGCDSTWGELWDRFMPGVDWSGLEEEMVTGWQRKGHIHQDPFYYVEYGLSQMGAVQVWRNSLDDRAGAVAAYRRALSLGSSVSVPELYAAAGAEFAFDAGPLSSVVRLMEDTIAALET